MAVNKEGRFSCHMTTRHIGSSTDEITMPPTITIDEQYAVVIGIDRYSSRFSVLENATRDASALSELLKGEYGFVLQPKNNPLLDDMASLDAIQAVVESTLRDATRSTRWLFYYAGHGIVEDGQGYLVPSDPDSTTIDRFVPIQWLLDHCIASKCAEILIILDACYGGRAMVGSEQLTDIIASRESADNIRQLISSGNPDEPVLDGGGSGHSVFSEALLDALKGWTGIHEDDGSVRFTRLLDHLVFEVPTRLRSQGIRAAQQQPIGGNIVGNSLRRDFVITATEPRLPPEIVRGTHSDDPQRRIQALARLGEECRHNLGLVPQAVKLTEVHLRRDSTPNMPLLTTSTLRYEPVSEVRSAAARVLGDLGDPAAVLSLIDALADEPLVCRSAAKALGKMTAVPAAAPLLHTLITCDNSLRLDIFDALAAVGDSEKIVSALGEMRLRGQLVPFLGPDLPSDQTGLPDRETITRRLAEREGIIDSSSLAQTASLSMHGGISRLPFIEFIKQEINDRLLTPGRIHQALAAFNSPLTICGTHDRLLVKAMNANKIINGEDTKYWHKDRPVVISLMGDLDRSLEMVVLAKDYELLRKNEGDRQILVSYLWKSLKNCVVLFLGYNPQSQDFALLVEHVLNGHLAGVEARAILVWPKPGPDHRWGQGNVHFIEYEPLDLLARLCNVDNSAPATGKTIGIT